MSCKSLYAANTASQTVASGGSINFGTAVRKRGTNCYISGGNVALRGAGYYDIFANVTFQASGAGTITVTLYKDGIAIPGATASLTVAASELYSACIPAEVKNLCCSESTVTAIVSGASVVVNNASVLVI